MKRKKIVFAVLFVSLAFSACGKRSNITNIYSEQDLSLIITDVTNTRVSIEIVNKKATSEVTTGNGTHFVLERNVNGVWYQMPENDVSRTFEGWLCHYNEPLTQEIELSLSYHSIRSGHYRLLKEVFVDGTSCWLFAEFDLD